MTTTSRRLAWSAPVLTAALVAGIATLPSASASPHPSLPAKTPAQLLAAVQTTRVTTLSGTVVETARLGLPSLPGQDSSAALTWQTLVTGTHSARIWVDGADRQRLALLGQLAESDVVHNGRDVWTYASDTQQVGHAQLPAEKADQPDTSTRKPDLQEYTPQGAADQALKAIDPSTVVTVDRTARVAGRPAYTLVLTPRDSRSTVRKVLIAIDAERSVPLRVQVFGPAVRPAFETAFTDVSYQRPAASVFAFTPPAGAHVSKDLLPAMTAGSGRESATPEAKDPATATKDHGSPSVLGTGWASVLVLPAGSSPFAGSPRSGHDSPTAVLDKLTTTLPGGDRLLRTALINVLMARDGRVLLGAVSPTLLQQAASGQLG